MFDYSTSMNEITVKRTLHWLYDATILIQSISKCFDICVKGFKQRWLLKFMTYISGLRFQKLLRHRERQLQPDFQNEAP